MTLILCHSPKGGVGNSFLSAQLATGLAARGHDVIAIDFTYQDALKLFFGMTPTQALPRLGEVGEDEMVVNGVSLLSGHRSSTQPGFADALKAGGQALFGEDRVVVADVASADRWLKEILLPYATLHLCAMLPLPAALATLGKVQADTPTIELEKTAFVLNVVDDTHKLSRHTKLFLGQLFGDGLIGSIRRDEAVNEAVASFQPIAKYAPHSAALTDIEALTIAVETRVGLVKSGEELA